MHTASVRDSVKLAISEFNKKSKKEVNYSTGKRKARCGLCEYFIPERDGSDDGTCAKVKGRINAEMWCELFEPK